MLYQTTDKKKRKEKNEFNFIKKRQKCTQLIDRYVSACESNQLWNRRTECAQDNHYLCAILFDTAWRLLSNIPDPYETMLKCDSDHGRRKKKWYSSSYMNLMIYRDEFIMCFTNSVIFVHFYVGLFDQLICCRCCHPFSRSLLVSFHLSFVFAHLLLSYRCLNIFILPSKRTTRKIIYHKWIAENYDDVDGVYILSFPFMYEFITRIAK